MESNDIKIVRGETVTVIGDKPDGWTGLGHTIDGADILVRYPDGEIGAVRPSDLSDPQ